MSGNLAFNKLLQVGIEVGGFFKLVGKVAKRVCKNCIEDCVRTAYRKCTSNRAELKAVSGKGSGPSVPFLTTLNPTGRPVFFASI